jgi:hypothetical protein
MRCAVTLVLLAACGSAAELPSDAASIDGAPPTADAESPPADAAPPPDAVTCTSVVVDGSVTIDSADDVAPLLPVAQITGDLLVVAPDVTSLDLPCLTQAANVTVRWPASLEELRLDALVSTRLTITGQPQLTELRLPAATEPVSLAVVNNERLATIEAPSMTSSLGTLELRDLPALATVSLPALTRVWELQVVDTGLTTLSLPALVESYIGATITDNLALTILDLPVLDRYSTLVLERDRALTTITLADGGTPGSSTPSVRIVDLDALTRLSLFDFRQIYGLRVEGNDVLTELDLYGASGNVVFLDNPQLSTCAIEALDPGGWTNEGNLDDTPCP